MADSIIKYSDLIGEDDTFDVIFDNIDKLRKELASLAKETKEGLSLLNPNDEKALKKATDEVAKLSKAKKNLDTEEKKAVKTKKKLNALTNEELITREKLKIANRERLQVAKQMAILTNKEAGQIEKLRANLSLTTLAWKKLSKEELTNTAKGIKLIATKKKLTNQLKKLEKQTGDTRRNVGNYTQSLGKLGKAAGAVFLGRSMVDGLRKIGAAMSNLIEKNKDTNKEIGLLDEALGKFGTAFSQLGASVLGFIAKPLTLLIEGLTALALWFADPVFKEFKATSEELGKEIEALNGEFADESAQLEILFLQLNEANKGTEERRLLINKINKEYGQYLPNLLTEESSLKQIAAALELANRALTKQLLLKIQNKTLIDVVTKKIQVQQKAFKELQETFKGSGAILEGEFLAPFSTLLEKWHDMEGAGKLARKALIAPATQLDKYIDKLKAVDEPLSRFIKKIREMGAGRGTLGFQTVAILTTQIEDAKRANTAFNKVIKDTQKGIANVVSTITSYTHASLQSSKITPIAIASSKSFKDNIEKRIAAIQSLQDKIRDSETDNIEDQTERLLALEQLKFEALQELRKENFIKFKALVKEQEDNVKEFHGKTSQELIDFKVLAADEILKFEKDSQKLSELQLQESKDRKLKIIEDAHQKIVDAVAKTVKAAQSLTDKQSKDEEKRLKEEGKRAAKIAKDIQKDIDENQKKATDAIKKKKDATQELLDGISATAAKIGAAIVSTFEKQADAASDMVKTQADAVETQRKRAEDGLSNTLKFEQEQLAQREADRIRAEKKAKQVAEFVTLLNLVSSYAASGDTNALARGLIDFSLLKALEAGFEEGGYTGDNGTSEISGVVHGREFVVTAEDVKRFGLAGKGGSDFGEAMSDYFYSPLQQNLFNGQADNFKNGMSGRPNDFARLEDEMRAMRQAFQAVPKNDFDIIQMTDYFIEIAKRVTSNRMTNVSKQRKRL